MQSNEISPYTVIGVGAAVTVGLSAANGSDYNLWPVFGGAVIMQIILPYVDIYRLNDNEEQP